MDEFRKACLERKIDQVNQLLSEDSNRANEEYDGIPMIEWVCEAGNVEVGQALVKAGAAADIFTASSLGLIETVKDILDKESELVHASRRLYAYHPIHCAAECGQPEALKLLIERGALVSARNEWGFTH